MLDDTRKSKLRWQTEQQMKAQHGEEEGTRQWKASQAALQQCGVPTGGKNTHQTVHAKKMGKKLAELLKKERVQFMSKDGQDGAQKQEQKSSDAKTADQNNAQKDAPSEAGEGEKLVQKLLAPGTTAAERLQILEGLLEKEQTRLK